MKSRTVIVCAAGILIAAGIILSRRPLQRAISVYAILHMNAPREQALDAVVDGSTDPVGMLIDLWSAGRIPQRHYAIEHLRSDQQACDNHWNQVWPVVQQALVSADYEEREPALMILGRHDSAAARDVAKGMLDDIDPEVRLLALQAVSLTAKDPESQAILTQSLKDADVHVRSFAQFALGSEGSRSASAPKQKEQISLPLPKYPLLDAVDFKLTDLKNHPIQLSQLRGKTVLVNFWLVGCGPCISEMPTLAKLQKLHPDDLAILAISVDGIGDEDSPDDTPAAPDPTSAVRKQVSKLAINFPVAVDREGTTQGAYEGSGVPTSVLIDTEGKIRRRFIGPRSFEIWESMLAELGCK